ncbi:TIM44-like domain-containing protein [Peribacillus sp. NPDC097198]|uniref:TIM44-like domain-containing protein n=1 Tax=Peribacillus sp. NPDC097198 TaxID=3364397 RepID=UPI0037F766B2
MMNKWNIQWIITLLLCFTSLLIFPVDATLADVGNGVSHNEEPEDEFINTSTTSGEGIDLWFLFYFLKKYPVLGVILIVAFFAYKKFGKSNQQTQRRTTTSNRNTVKSPEPAYRPIDANLAGLKSKDPLFHDEVFLSKINNMFLQLQQAWMEKQWNSIRPFETDSLFNMHNRQLQSYIDQHKTNVVENIAILESKIVRYENDGSNDELDVYIKARMNDYVIDDHTKKVLKGNPDQDIHMSYIWTLIRKETVLTETQKEKYDVTQCPNCGANVSINASGQCEYCDSVISSGEYDWVLSKIKVISQK